MILIITLKLEIMKNVFRFVFIVVAIQFANFNLVNAQTNLIPNPGFESGLASWIPYAVDQAKIDSTGGHTGTKLLVLNTMVSADGAAVAQYGVPCKEGNYTFSFWIKGDSTFIGVVLNGLGADGNEFSARWVGGSDFSTKGNPTTWEKVSYNFDIIANEGETGLNLRLFIKSNKKNVGSKVLVDDASLVRNNPAPPVDANNVILNPGFESGLAPWLAYSGLKDGSHASIDSTGGYTGAKLLVITTPAKFASGEGGAGVAQNDVPAQPGGNYTYSAWIKGDSTYIGVIEKGLDSDGIKFIRWIGGSDAAAKAKPGTWEKVTYTFDLPNDGETNVTFRLFVYSIKKRIGSQVLVDDASLVKNYMTGISKTNEEALMVYPNPVVDKLNISLNSGISEVSIYDISGKPICKNTFANTSVSLNVSNFAKGVYIVKINNKYFHKIVK